MKHITVSVTFLSIIIIIVSTYKIPSYADNRAANRTCDVPTTNGVNVLSRTFKKLGKNRLPIGWKITKWGKNSSLARVTVERGNNKEPNAVKVRIPREANVYVDTNRRAKLDPKKEYLLVVQFKVENMHYTGHWYYRPAGLWIEVYGLNNKHLSMKVRGEGSTRGWVTTVRAFLNKKNKKTRKDAQYLAQPNVFLRCYNMAGTVYFRNPMIVEKPAGYDATTYFETEDGMKVFGSVFTLTK